MDEPANRRICNNCRHFSLDVMTLDPGPEHDEGQCNVAYPTLAWVSAVHVCERWELEPSMAILASPTAPRSEPR